MPFRVVPARQAQQLADLVQGIILMHRHRGRRWTEDALLEELARVGVDFSPAEVLAILAELRTRGVVQDVL